MSHTPHRSHWNNRWTFMLATAGSAIGLGNIWKLPYMIGVNGGSAFVIIFLLCIFLVGIPLMMTEILLGRRAQKNPLDGMAALAHEANTTSHWKWLRWHGHDHRLAHSRLLQRHWRLGVALHRRFSKWRLHEHFSHTIH